jgi:hypothetical protein
MWRESLSSQMASESVTVARILFPNLAPRHQRGRPRNADVAAWNHTLRKYVRSYNQFCGESGHPELVLDAALVSSHKIGRPVHITSLALAKVDDKVAMEETGIEDERTLARYKRFSDSERREMLARTDGFISGLNPTTGHDAPGTPRELLELLRRQAPPGKVEAWNMIVEGILSLLANGTA